MKNKHINEIVRGASSAFLVKILAAGMTFLFYLYLGRELGAEKSGTFFLGLTILTIASVIGRFGLENTLLRVVAKNAVENKWDLIVSAYRKSFRYVFFISLLITIVVCLLSNELAKLLFSTSEKALYIQIFAISIVPLALSVLHAQAIQGLKKVKESTLVLNLAIPSMALLISVLLAPDYDVLGVLAAYSASIYVTFFISYYLWKRLIPDQIIQNNKFSASKLFESCIPLFWVSVMQMVINWLSYLVLGFYSSESEVGILGVAIRVTTLLGFFLMAANSITAPKIAEMYKKDENQSLENMCRGVSTFLFYITLPFILIILAFPDQILALFGSEFEGNQTVLRILVVGQFVNIFTGSVGNLLIMSGNERIMRNNLLLTMIVCIVLNFYLIPMYGLIGAAVVFSCTMTLQNLILVYKVKKHLRIYTLPYLNPLKVSRIV